MKICKYSVPLLAQLKILFLYIRVYTIHKYIQMNSIIQKGLKISMIYLFLLREENKFNGSVF